MKAMCRWYCALSVAAMASSSAAFGGASIKSTSRAPTDTHSLAFATRRHHARSSPLHPITASVGHRGPRPLHRTSTLSMLSHPYDALSALASLTFWPLIDYLSDLATFVFILSFMFAAVSLFVTTSTDERVTGPPLSLASVGEEVNGGEESEDDLLTPGTYADARSAKRRVKDEISSKALEAFSSTDFEHEPHLSPELEDAELAYEVALIANAAHELADAAEKESRQSRAAMLERERELEWIEHHEEGGDAVGTTTAMAATDGEALRARKQEEFQRSLLSARIAYDAKVREAIVEEQLKEEYMGSEVLAASMGGKEFLPFGVASAAATSAAKVALEEVESEGNDDDAVADESDVDGDAAPAAAASMIADTAERMILGEDLALFEHSPEMTTALSSDSEDQSVVPDEVIYKAEQWVKNDPAQDEVVSEAEQWRKDWVDQVRNYVNQEAIAKNKEKMLARSHDGNTSQRTSDAADDGTDGAIVDPIASDDAAGNPSKDLDVKQTSSGGDSVIKRTLQRGFVRQVIQRRRFLVTALAVVLCRRLFLAYFGNVSRLI